MFKVPDWGNDIPKSDVDISKLFSNKDKKKKSKNNTNLKNNGKESKDVKTNKQKNNVNGIGKLKKKFGKKKTSHTILSKEDHINNRILKRNLKNTSEVKSAEIAPTENAEGEFTLRNKSNVNIRNINNQIKNKTLKGKKKFKNIESKSESGNENKFIQKTNLSNSSRVKKVARKRLINGSIKNSKEEDGLDIQSFNTDEPDKVLVNAKRKKLSDKIKNDDVEDVLFSNRDNPDAKTSNKSKKSKLGKKEDATSCEVEGNEEEQTGFSKKEQKIQKKKEKIKEILKQDSNRNVINTSGNKLRMRMMERLKAAQFRYLNEKLYTSSGSESQELFKSDPTAFQTYHEGYQLQVKKWPINPLDIIVKRILKMPKSHVIADMGCGEAALSRRVPHTVHSFDLVAAPGVRACDMAHTPLPAAAAHAAVYCLALMGTDLTRYLLEANRILKIGGHLLIAEVESRFDNPDDFSRDVQRLGFSLKKLDTTHKMFIFMEFNKVREAPSKKSKLPTLSLKPCLYKRR